MNSPQRRSASRPHHAGYAMAALLVMLAIISVVVGMALPMWRTVAQREKEEELVFRGRQYARAVGLYQRKFANAYPPSIQLLLDQKFLRKKYKDPMTEDGEFQVLYQNSMPQTPGGRTTGPGSPPGQTGQPSEASPPGGGQPGRRPPQGGIGAVQGATPGTRPAGPQGGVVGVASKSKRTSLRLYNGRSVYNEWQFIWVPSAQGPQTGPAGGPGRPSRPGPPPGRGRQGPSGPGTRPPDRR